MFLNFEFCFFLAEASGGAAAVSPPSRGCEEAIVQRVVRRGSEVFLNFEFVSFWQKQPEALQLVARLHVDAKKR